MRNNHGFAMIELIAVIFIISLLVVGVTLGYGSIRRSNARMATKKITNALELIRIENMTKSSVYSMTITQSNDKDYYLNILCDGEIISSEKFKFNGNISYETADNERIMVSVSDELEIIFRKDTGGVKENSRKQVVTGIRIEEENNTLIIRLVTATGKTFIE